VHQGARWPPASCQQTPQSDHRTVIRRVELPRLTNNGIVYSIRSLFAWSFRDPPGKHSRENRQCMLHVSVIIEEMQGKPY
jgi:hypothetical protein